MANKGATVPQLAASAGWSMDTAAKNMDTYVVTSGPLADEGHNLRDEHIKGTEKSNKSKNRWLFRKKSKKWRE